MDLVAFQESTTNNGWLGVAPAAGGSHGYLISGDDLKVKWPSRIHAALLQSAAIANWVEGGFVHTDDVPGNAIRTPSFVRDQTGAIVPPWVGSYFVPKGSSLKAYANHGNNAQVASLLALLAPDGKHPDFRIGTPEPGYLPPDCKTITGTGVTAAEANKWSDDVCTYTYTWNDNGIYRIHGLSGFSTTGYGFRVLPQTDDSKFRPGWVLGDTSILTQPIYSKEGFLDFPGSAPPQFQKLCSGTDSTASRYNLLIRRIA